MARHALIRPDNSIDRFDERVDPTVQTKAGWRWLPATPAAVPAHDSATQIVEGPARTVGADAVTESYTVRNKTAQEIDDNKTQQTNAVNKVLAAALFDLVNEVRALKVPPQPALTKPQFLTWLKSKVGAF